MKFKIINVVSLILIHEKLGKFQMIIALMQYLLLQILLFEHLIHNSDSKSVQK